MLRIFQSTSASNAKSYYSSGDYYVDGQELPGVWRGKGAEKLGLAGEISKEDWERICDHLDPKTGQALFQRRNDLRTTGYDFNFHVPKSVSLLYAETKDERLLNAFRDSVRDTMDAIEAEAQTRVRKDGRHEDRFTRNLMWGEFVHFTARPVGGIPDPHLHIHAYALNCTFDGDENRWKAAQFRELNRDAPYFQAMFHAKLSRKLGDLGLPIERTANGWELGELTKPLLEKFSRRTTEIEKKASLLGITSPDAKGELGAKTRNRKSVKLTGEQLQTAWREMMTSDERAALAGLADRVGGASAPVDAEAAQKSIAYALDHELERSSVVSERKLLATAMRHGVGHATPDDIIAAYRKVDVIRADRDGRIYVTTPQVLAEEREIVKFAKSGRGVCQALAKPDRPLTRTWLNTAQQAAVRHILSSRDRVLMLRGVAGTGKTTLMQEAVEAIEQGGTKVLAFAPSAAASRGVLRTDGFAEADTVARLLIDEKLQEKAKNGVLWIDEAGLLGTRTMRDVFRLADRLDARVLLTGDRFQHGSVDRGAALRLLETEAGIKPATVKEIQRQEGDYKAAVHDLSEGLVGEGFSKLDKLGWVKEVATEDRYKMLASDYVAATKESGDSLIVAPTHAEGGRVTLEIRKQLQAAGKLAKDEREFTTLVNSHLTEAEKTDARSYEPGQVVQFFQNAKGHTRGDRIVVGEGKLPLESSHRFTVFRQGMTKLAAGDLIRITHNGMTADNRHRLDNGSVYEVKSFDAEGNIVLKNDWTVSKDFCHFVHGYVVTSHASQGRNIKHVFIAESAESFAAASREQFYVSVSRGKKSATIYTDNKKELLEAAMRSDERISATQLALRARRFVRRAMSCPVEQPQKDRTHQKELVHER